MHRVLCVFLPTWPTDRLRRSASVPDAPLITVHRIGSRRLIASACTRAHAMGLRAGMAVAQAQAMVPQLDTAPAHNTKLRKSSSPGTGLHITDADPAGDQAALTRLAAWCLRFSPLAAVSGTDGLWIETAGCAHLFGGEAAMLTEITSRLAVAGFASRAAIAPTPGAAHALAHYGLDAVTILPANAEHSLTDALESLPVAALRLPDATLDALRLLGFDRIGQLARAPRAPLARRFGSTVATRLDQALGRVPEPIEPILPPEMPRSRLGFPEPIATADDFQRAIQLLTQALCLRLERRALGACRLDLLFQRIDGTTQAIRIGTSAPTRDAAHLARLLEPQIETIDPGFGVERMMLSATLTDHLGASQLRSGLDASPQTHSYAAGHSHPAGHSYAGGPSYAGHDIAAFVDTLLSRLGEAHVFRAHPVESDLPERSHKRVPPMAQITGAAWPDHLPRPARLFDPPRPVDAFALLPDHAPARFTWRGRPHRVRRSDGPERVFGEWWSDPAETWAVRDYFQVEDENGQRFWLFRRGNGTDLETGDHRWFLHGIFG